MFAGLLLTVCSGTLADRWFHASGHIATIICTPAGTCTCTTSLLVLLDRHAHMHGKSWSGDLQPTPDSKNNACASCLTQGVHQHKCSIAGGLGSSACLLEVKCDFGPTLSPFLCLARSICAAAPGIGKPWHGPGRIPACPSWCGDVVLITAACIPLAVEWQPLPTIL